MITLFQAVTDQGTRWFQNGEFLLCMGFYCLHKLIYALQFYQVLGVDKNAGQREIQKAFHKYAYFVLLITFLHIDLVLCDDLADTLFSRLSLQYHPDKNKAKGAQEKFAQINNGIKSLLSFSICPTHSSSYLLQQRMDSAFNYFV